jgi:nucleoside-diphosphate-sugar epimerase
MDLLLYDNYLCVLQQFGNEKYEYLYGDMRDVDLVNRALVDVDSVVILAGLVGDPITRKYPKIAQQINYGGVRNVIDCCIEKSINKIIFVSTCSNYGVVERGKIADETYMLNPLSSYAKSKVEIEEYLCSLKSVPDFQPVILRFATAFGLSPRMRFDLTLNEFTRELFLGRELGVYDADTWRPYCHVLDFARLIRVVLKADKEKTSFQIFNSGGERSNCTKRMIVEYIQAALPESKVRYIESGKDGRDYRVNFDKIRTVLGFEPVHTIRDGISEIVAACNQHIFDRVEKNRKFFGNYYISLEEDDDSKNSIAAEDQETRRTKNIRYRGKDQYYG